MMSEIPTGEDERFHELLKGVRMRYLNHGERMHMVEFLLDEGSVIPLHSHPYEQSGYLISGLLRMACDGEVREIGPGGSWSIPENVEHGVDVLQDAHLVELFSPPREDYLPERWV